MTEEMFDDFLDEVFPVYEMGDLAFYPSQIMKALDPISYEIAYSEWATEEEERDF